MLDACPWCVPCRHAHLEAALHRSACMLRCTHAAPTRSRVLLGLGMSRRAAPCVHACMQCSAKAPAHACILSPRLYAGMYVCSTSRETRRPYYYPATPKHTYTTHYSATLCHLSLCKATFCTCATTPLSPSLSLSRGVHKCVRH